MIVKWKCNECGEINKSDSEKTHQINMCKCGKSGVDLEEYYERHLGNLTILERESSKKDINYE